MADDFRLLLKAVVLERPAGLQAVAVAAERMAHQRQVEAPALLRLPDVGHFVNEQALPMERLAAKSSDQRSPWGWKWMLPIGAIADRRGWNGHHLRRTSRTRSIVDGVAEDGSCELDFARGERA